MKARASWWARTNRRGVKRASKPSITPIWISLRQGRLVRQEESRRGPFLYTPKVTPGVWVRRRETRGAIPLADQWQMCGRLRTICPIEEVIGRVGVEGCPLTKKDRGRLVTALTSGFLCPQDDAPLDNVLNCCMAYPLLSFSTLLEEC